MSSQARLAANRANARKSRGPRTAAGRTRASRNALRHGLAAISRHNPAYFPEIGRMASAYCEGDTDPLLFEQALIIAESDIILICLGGERLAAIERMRDPDAIPFLGQQGELGAGAGKVCPSQTRLCAAGQSQASEGGEHFGQGQSLDFSTEKPGNKQHVNGQSSKEQRGSDRFNQICSGAAPAGAARRMRRHVPGRAGSHPTGAV